LQFRMVEDDYEQAKFDYKLQGVYLFDAPPTRELRQLDADAVKDLDKMFGAVLAGKKKPTAAKSNKAGGKKTPPTKPVAGKKLRPGASTKDKVQANADVDAHVAADAEERDAREQAKVAKRQAAKDKREASAAAKKAGKKTGPPAVSGKKSPAEDEDVAACTHTEAWDAMVEARENAGLGEGVAEEAYRNSVFAVVGDLKSDDQLEAVTDAQWAEVRDIALTEINDLLDSPAN